jgi:hypothetical protein
VGKNGTEIVIPEEIQKKSVVKAIEGDLPYEKTLYANHLRLLFKHTAESLIVIGKMLLVMKENEGHGEFMQIVEAEIGVPYKTAQRCMNAARKAVKYPEIGFSKMDKLSNLYVLLEAPEEDLKELEEKGVLAGNTIDELRGMSIKDMRNLIRKLREKGEKVIGKSVSKLEGKNRELNEEAKQLRLQLRLVDKSATAFQDAYMTAQDLLDQAIRLLNDANSSPMVASVLEDKKTLQKYTNAANLFEKKFKGCLAIMREALS